MITTPWPNLLLYAKPAGEVDPYDPANAHLFRGEEAFSPGVTGWRRWSKPSPEPRLDVAFERLLLASIEREKAAVLGMVEALADRVAAAIRSPPLLVAILRAGVPVGALLARSLRRRLGGPVPLAALSLFDGLGWDAVALEAALIDHPGRPVLFVDGWTGRGGVARELQRSYERWLDSGRPDFTGGGGPRLAVLCDPRGLADFSAVRADRFVPSSLFTAPETLGFSRGFADGPTTDGGMLRVYEFPARLLKPALVDAWLTEDGANPVVPGDTSDETPPASHPPPDWRLHVNEVVRALINRNPREVLLRESEAAAGRQLAPLLYLCRLRGVPVSYGREEVASWGAVAAARMADRRAAVLDLDYTLLHLEATPGAIEVPGRTRSAYLAASTADALADLQERHDLFLSTARSWRGTQPVVEGLARRGVTVSGVVLEDGALLGPPGEHRPLQPERNWSGLRHALDDAALHHPPFAWQEDFEACLVARARTPAEAETLLARLGGEAMRLDPTVRAFRDGRKVYLAGSGADKWTALEVLVGPDQAAGAVGIGDGTNDLCWLSRVALPCTLSDAAPEVVALVRERGGFVSKEVGHTGIGELLRRVGIASTNYKDGITDVASRPKARRI